MLQVLQALEGRRYLALGRGVGSSIILLKGGLSIAEVRQGK